MPGIVDGKRALLVLSDGTAITGLHAGAEGESFGEICFHTGMMGYQEVLTDPSSAGLMFNMTYPLIGNCGVNPEDCESDRVHARGLVMRELSRTASNWRSTGTLGEFLLERGVVGLEGIDTRALARHIRARGAMRAGLSSVDLDPASLLDKVVRSPGLPGADLVKEVTSGELYVWEEGLGGGPDHHVVAFDFGIRRSVLRLLAGRGCRVTVVPASTTARDALGLRPDGIVLSNGPGDPAAVTYAVETVRGLLGRKPVFGVSLGHQLLALALGGGTRKLASGHRGANQPVVNVETGEVEITSQGHGFVVEAESFPENGFGRVEVSHLNLNDRTCEGIRCPDVGALSVQWQPEACPGPHGTPGPVDDFVRCMREWSR